MPVCQEIGAEVVKWLVGLGEGGESGQPEEAALFSVLSVLDFGGLKYSRTQSS